MSVPQQRKPKPIVVAESNFLTGRLILSALQSAGHSAVVARSGDEVLRLIDQHQPEVLVLNMNLARPSGLELLRTLQQRQVKVKILAATAVGQAELKASAGTLGVSGFFEFPFSPTELSERVGQLIGV